MATIDLATLTTGTAGATIYGAAGTYTPFPGDHSGSSVSNAGDMNGNGFDDLIIGAPYAGLASNSKLRAGESYVVFGGASLPSTIDLASLANAGITIFGAFGAGVVNGDYSGLTFKRIFGGSSNAVGGGIVATSSIAVSLLAIHYVSMAAACLWT